MTSTKKNIYVFKRERKSTFGMPKVLYSCSFLSPPVVPTLVIYNGAELNGIMYIYYYVSNLLLET